METITPAKKQWQKPDFYLLSSDNVTVGNKSMNNYYEHSASNIKISYGKPVGQFGNPTFYILSYLAS